MLLRFWLDVLELITIFKTQVKFVINKIVRVKGPWGDSKVHKLV